MGTAKDETCTKCLYLLKDMDACSIRPDGVYIPPRMHSLTYCLTQSYKQCPTYARFYQMEKNNMETVPNTHSGRRRFLRIPKKHSVLIQTCNSIGAVIGTFAEQALILDYSPGGMRIQFDREIPTDSLLLFNFGNDFVVPQLEGIAKISWHRKLKDKPQNIEAGLAFQDHFSQAVLAIQTNY